MKLYNIHNGKVYSLEVKETRQFYKARKTLWEFDSRINIEKENCLFSLSPKEAIEKEIKKLRNLIEIYQQRFEKARTDLGIVCNLKTQDEVGTLTVQEAKYID